MPDKQWMQPVHKDCGGGIVLVVLVPADEKRTLTDLRYACTECKSLWELPGNAAVATFNVVLPEAWEYVNPAELVPVCDHKWDGPPFEVRTGLYQVLRKVLCTCSKCGAVYDGKQADYKRAADMLAKLPGGG